MILEEEKPGISEIETLSQKDEESELLVPCDMVSSGQQ
jgi:hypothetical protein